MTDLAVPAMIGELVVLVVIVAVVAAVFREVARAAIKVLVPVGLVVAVAVWLGLLEQTMVERALAAIGDTVMGGIRDLADWVATTTVSA